MDQEELGRLADESSAGVWKAAYWPLPTPHYWIGLHNKDTFSSRLDGQVTGPIASKADADLIEIAPQMARLLNEAFDRIEDKGWRERFAALDDPFGFRTGGES